MPKYEELIDALVLARKSKGLTQEDVSALSGIPQSVIARIERKKSVPTMTTFCRIASAVDVTLTLK